MRTRAAALVAVVVGLVLVPTAAAAPSITTTSLAGATSGAAYSKTLTASGGTTPYAWTLDSGSLPAGLTLSSAGVISGTPTSTNDATFTVRVTDAVPESATKTFTIVVHAAPAVSTTSLGGATVGTPFSKTLAGTGGTTPFTWSLASGTLPGGITLAGSTGVLSGTPTTAGSHVVGIKITDANTAVSATTNLTLTVADKVAVSTSTLPGGTMGASYATTLAATGGTAPLAWSVATGTLPPGLTLSSAGALSGTPTQAGTFSFEVKPQDAVGSNATKALSVTIAATLSIDTGSLPGSTQGTPYSKALSISGGTAPVTWTVASGALPAGLTIAAGGQITGTATTSGEARFVVKATDAAGAVATRDLSLLVAPRMLFASPRSLKAKVGKRFTHRLRITGGTRPFIISRSAGSLPPGLRLSGGTISGRPLRKGTFRLTVFVTDGAGATLSMRITIAVKR